MYILGIDEVGRGALAGNITACGILMKTNGKRIHGIFKDSKQLTSQQRESVAFKIENNKDILSYWSTKDAYFIDRYGIQFANQEIVLDIITFFMKYKPQRIYIDWISGLKNKSMIKLLIDDNVEIKIEPKADEKYKSVALASILAKVFRDSIMKRVHYDYPVYNFKNNKGYGTSEHINAIKHYGISPYHRLSFLKKINKNILKFGDG